MSLGLRIPLRKFPIYDYVFSKPLSACIKARPAPFDRVLEPSHDRYTFRLFEGFIIVACRVCSEGVDGMGNMSAYQSIFRLDTRVRENFHEGQAFPAIILEVFKQIAMQCKILYRSYHYALVKLVRLFVEHFMTFVTLFVIRCT